MIFKSPGNTIWLILFMFADSVLSTPTPESYRCGAGYTGVICDVIIDNCASQPCQNGATCSYSLNAYKCTCPVGATGINCETNVAQNTLGYEPKDRIFVDGAGHKWTVVQKQGFPSDGVLTGFNVYAKVSSQPSRPVYFGIYRPVANTSCTFTLLKLWHPIITDLNKVTQIVLSESDQFAFRAGDTIGYSWNNGGIIPCDTGTDFNYCEDSKLTGTEKDVTLVGNRYGNRVYSFQAVYKRVLGFSPIQRKVTDTPQVWTFILKQGFSTNGTIKGFNVFTQFTTAARSFNFGLYRPVDGKTCTFTLLKLWTPTVSVANNVTEIAFSAADQFAFEAGDTIGYTWTNYGGIPWDFYEEFSYCEDGTQVKTVGQQIALYDGRIGNRRYSFEAII